MCQFKLRKSSIRSRPSPSFRFLFIPPRLLLSPPSPSSISHSDPTCSNAKESSVKPAASSWSPSLKATGPRHANGERKKRGRTRAPRTRGAEFVQHLVPVDTLLIEFLHEPKAFVSLMTVPTAMLKDVLMHAPAVLHRSVRNLRA